MAAEPSSSTARQAAEAVTDDPAFDQILAFVQSRRQVDFRRYRPAMILRRTLGRMRLVGVEDFRRYLSLLTSDAQEVDHLVGYLTISVSRFFRDAPVFDLLRQVALPDLQRGGQSLRVWSAGCGNGEEAYSLAMLLPEAGLPGRIFATDIDELALARARAGRYRAEALHELPPEMVQDHFIPEPGRTSPQLFVVHPTLKPRVTFLRHDLTAGGLPCEDRRFHLICCRNVLIYLNRETQAQVQHLLARSLLPGGYLCLGEAETLSSSVEAQFDIIDRKARLYRRRGTSARAM